MSEAVIYIKQKYELLVKLIVCVFYAVGIAGMLNPFTHLFFIKLIPFALIFSFGVLVFFHKAPVSNTAIIIFFLIYLTGYAVEVLGVNTGVIFGNYYYGDNLGIKLFNTPIIIGLNWLLIVYLSSSVIGKTKFSIFVKILLASAIMLVYDITLENVAPALGLWYWQSGSIPLQNYAAWVIVGLFFISLLHVFRINTENRMSGTLLICQFLFFTILSLFLK